MTTPWIYLVIAGLLEVCWVIGMKYADGFTKLFPSIFTIAALILSMYMLARAAQSLPLGTAYAVWVGIGSFGAAFLGIVLFKEPASALRIVFLAMLLASIIGLKLTSAE